MSNLVDEAARSLGAVNAWINVIEGNIAGSKRTAFKSSRVSMSAGVKMMDGGSNQLARKNAIGEVTIPDASLTVAQVTLDMKQGDIVDSTEDTHIAILGTGFFVCTDKASFDGDTKVYYTRDGEFYWDTQGFLRTSNGLYVANRDYPPYDPEKTTIAAKIKGGTDDASNYFVNSKRTAGGVIKANDLDKNNSGVVDVNRIGLAHFANDSALEYSKFGTSYMLESNSSGRPTYFAADDPAQYAQLKTRALETSNGSMTEFIPMLTVAQKAFSAISKIIAVYNSTVDDMNNTIR